MKKLITVFIIIFSFTATAQTYILSENGVRSFKNFNKADAKRLVVADEINGGDFNLYLGADPVDNGMIFLDAIGRKWKRVQFDNKINIKWYGAIGTENNTPNDAFAAIIAARNYCYAHKGSVLYIPFPGGTNGYYFVGKTLDFTNHDISIEGENFGASHSANSILKFPGNVTGFDFNMTFNQARFITIKNLRLQGGGLEAGSSYATWNTTKHGIQINCNFNIENVYVTNFSGDAFHVTGGNGLGSTNRAVFRNCEGDYSYNGFYIEGYDANNILFDNCSGVQNKRWGFLDKGFLGNTYNNCHTATNALLEIRTDDYVKASFKGISYVAKTDDSFNNTNFRPDLHPDKWDVYNAQGLQPPWDSKRRYYSGGAYCSTNGNAYHFYTNCYSEGYQPSSRFSPRSMVLNGTQEAGSYGGGYMTANFDAMIFHRQTNFAQKITLGNVYNPTSNINFDNLSPTPAERWTEIKADNSLPKANIRMYGNGNINFGSYNAANAVKGAPVASLQVDARGNVITGQVAGNTMTKKDRDAIVSPTQGMLIFVTDNGGYLSWYNAGWQKISSVKD